jgi:transglutaminase-like putative cysteine protease
MRKARSLFAVSMLGLLATAACSAAPDPPLEEVDHSSEAMILRCLQSSTAPAIASVFPVVQSGSSWSNVAATIAGTPEVGQAQGLEIDWSTPTLPANPFVIRVHIPGANIDTTVGGPAVPITGAGVPQKLLVPLNIPGDPSRPIPLDGPIPYTVTLDATHVSGLPGVSCSYSGSYTPTPPSAALEGYASQTRTASISLVAGVSPAVGATGTMFMGYPLSTSHQTVLSTLVNSWSVVGLGALNRRRLIASGSFPTVTTGALPPFYAQTITPYLSGATAITSEIEVEVQLSRLRVNRDLLNQVTWDEITFDAQGTPALQAFLGPDAVNDPNDPSIAAFVQQTLGAGYKSAMTPYTAATKLFVAVANAITYQAGTASKPTPSTAVAALAAGWGDCGDYGMLLTTVLRAIGIPTRIAYGQWPTGGGTHVINEIWFPGAGWISADATSSSVIFPKSGYPYFFGNVPALDIWVAFGFGNHYAGDGLDLAWLEGPGFTNNGANVSSWNVTQTNDPAP